MNHRTFLADNTGADWDALRSRAITADLSIMNDVPEFIMFSVGNRASTRIGTGYDLYFAVLNKEDERYNVYWIEESLECGYGSNSYTVADTMDYLRTGAWVSYNKAEGVYLGQYRKNPSFEFPSDYTYIKVDQKSEPVIEDEEMVDLVQDEVLFVDVFFDEEHERWGFRSVTDTGEVTPDLYLIDLVSKSIADTIKFAGKLAEMNGYTGVTLTSNGIVVQP